MVTLPFNHYHPPISRLLCLQLRRISTSELIMMLPKPGDTMMHQPTTAYNWGRMADWIARHDYRIPIYHRICLAVWVWALRHSLTN
jgi:hypothetical protein